MSRTTLASSRRYGLTALLSVSLMLAGCQSDLYHAPMQTRTASSGSPASSGAGGYGSAPAQVNPRLARSNEAEFFSQSGFTACAGAAAIGALACQLSNASNKSNCMLKAALLACGVAMGANYYLDQRRAEYSSNEGRLDAMIKDVQDDNRKLQTLSQTAREVMAEDRQKLARLSKDMKAKTLEQSQARRQIAEVDANTSYLRGTLAKLRAREQQWRDVAAAERQNGARVDSLDSEIASMQRQISSLESEINELYQQRSAIVLG